MTVQKMIAGLVPKMRSMPQPIIAAVNGAASGGGLALALASDVRDRRRSRRASTSRSSASGCRAATSACRGCCRGSIGASRAFELLLTGRLDRRGRGRPHRARDARRARRRRSSTSALETAELIVGNSPFGVRMTKEVMWSQLEIGSLQAGIDLENRTQVLSSFTGDLTEAMAAFVGEAAAAVHRRVGDERAWQSMARRTRGAGDRRRAGDRQGDRARAGRGRRRRRGQLPHATRTSARETVAEIEKLGRRAVAYAASVDDYAQCEAMVAAGARRLRRTSTSS